MTINGTNRSVAHDKNRRMCFKNFFPIEFVYSFKYTRGSTSFSWFHCKNKSLFSTCEVNTYG